MDDAGQICQRLRLATPATDYTAVLDTIQRLVNTLEAQTAMHHSLPVGIGTPGSLNPQGLLRNSNTTCLNGQPLRDDLCSLLQREVRTANDADCFALSEATDGAGKAFNTVFGVILGTGVGGGIVINKQLLTGPNAVSGEWGHNPFPKHLSDTDTNPRPCYCGKHDCIETWLSGPALALDHQQHWSLPERASAKDIATAAVQLDGRKTYNDQCRATLERYAERLARALATVINVVDPEVIVLGGGVGNIDSLYPALAKHLEHWVFSTDIQTTITQPVYGDSSGVRGAAWLWPATPTA